jgi:Flp pilus assembly protein TadB
MKRITFLAKRYNTSRFSRRTQQKLYMAMLMYTPSQWLTRKLVTSGVFSLFLLIATGSLWPSLLFAVSITRLLAWGILYWRRNYRSNAVVEAVPFIARGVAAEISLGKSISEALLTIVQVQALSNVLASQFCRHAANCVVVGLSVPDALRSGTDHVTKRRIVPEMQGLLTIINAHAQYGGNIAHTLQRWARAIEEKQKIRRQAQSMVTEARFVAAAVPVVAFLAMVVLVRSDKGALYALSTALGTILVAILFSIALFGTYLVFRLTRLGT